MAEVTLLSCVKAFLAHRLSAPQFSADFIQRYKQDSESSEEPAARFFDAVFAACDAYCEDESLRDAYDFDEKQLYERVQALYSAL